MKRLHARFGDDVRFLDVLIRQAHPGGGEREYHDFRQKLADARAYRHQEQIPWSVLVDDVEGSVHQAWGGLSDPAWLIDRDGRIAFFCTWTAPRALRRAMEDLLAQGGAGVVRGGIRRTPQMGPMLMHGWRAIERGLPGSAVDLMTAAPMSPVALWVGYQVRRALVPITGDRAPRRVLSGRSPPRAARRLRAPVVLGVAAAALALGLLVLGPRSAAR